MTDKEMVKFIAEWCSENGSAESVFLTPQAQHFVYTFSLFDALAEKTGLTKDQIGAWFNARQEKGKKPS